MKIILVDSGGQILCIFSQQHEALHHHQSLRDSLVIPLLFSNTKAAGAMCCKREWMNRETHNSCSSFMGQHRGGKYFKQGTKPHLTKVVFHRFPNPCQ